MADIEEITKIAKQVWPDADHIDIIPAPIGDVTVNDSNAQSFRLNAIHPDGSIMEQVIADDLETLTAKLKARLMSKHVP
jgi:hypothetical protein